MMIEKQKKEKKRENLMAQRKALTKGKDSVGYKLKDKKKKKCQWYFRINTVKIIITLTLNPKTVLYPFHIPP